MQRFMFCLVLIGCTSASEPPHLDLVSDPYTLQPGDEKYYCYTTTLPADKDVVITKLTPTYGEGTHHILFAQTIAPEPDGFSECPLLVKTTWVPLYAGGKDSGPLQLPPDTGFKPLERGQQILLQLHLQNASDAPITAKTAMRIDYEDATPDVIPAMIYGIDNRVLNIPANTNGAMNQMSCTVDRDLSVFAVLGHEHKHGATLAVSRGATPGVEYLYQENWNFDVQPVTPMSFQVHNGDNLFLQCTYNNTTDMAIPYGESSDQEMCSFVMYYSPSTVLDGCINM